MVKNEYGVKRITMYPEAMCYCPLGKDWYTNHFEVKMDIGSAIPDYCEVAKWLDENICGESLIIEDVLKKFRKYLNETYSPVALEVISSVNDAKHFPVRVEA